MDLARAALVASACVFDGYWMGGVLVVGEFLDRWDPVFPDLLLRLLVESLRRPYLLAAAYVTVYDAVAQHWARVFLEVLVFVCVWFTLAGLHRDRWKQRRRRPRAASCQPGDPS